MVNGQWSVVNVVIAVVAAMTICSCSGDRQSFTLSGKFKGLEQGEFICFSESPAWGTLDTVRIQGGKFSITHPLADTVVLTLQYPNFMQTQVIAIPGKKVTISGDANNMLAIEVSGDDENELLSQFRKNLKSQNPQTLAGQFITEHPRTWAAYAVFQKYILQVEHPDYKQMAKLSQYLPRESDSQPFNSLTRQLVNSSTITLSGDTLDFRFSIFNFQCPKLKGTPLLITFWSTMAPEHSYTLTSQRHLMRRLSPRLQQLNVCLDTDTTACRSLLRRDSIGGYNVCDLRTFSSPLVTAFGLRRLPSNVLVDATGRIRERDIPLDKLESTLRKYGIQ